MKGFILSCIAAVILIQLLVGWKWYNQFKNTDDFGTATMWLMSSGFCAAIDIIAIALVLKKKF